MSNDTNKIDELFTRGIVETIGKDQLKERLEHGDMLRIKFGIDPTSPHMHLGRAVPLLKLRDFQQLGHKIVFIVGDFTGVIGDTSDKDSERPMLSQETIDINKKTYFEQVGKLIDLEQAEFRYNNDWLSSLTYREICEHANQFSVADFIARENIKKRLDTGKRVSLREVLYPLMQGYDSVAVHADVEIGGTDQRFNILAGRTLQEHFHQKPQAIMMGPLIDGLDGRKMSSSWGNTITLDAAPADMYGKIMSLRDELIGTYFELCTRIPMNEVREIQDGLKKETLHPKDAKMRLAREIVMMYHGAGEATKAEEQFTSTFGEGGIPSDIQEVQVQKNAVLVDVLIQTGVVASKTEWRRLVEDGAVTVPEKGHEKITDHNAIVSETVVVKVGKRRFIKITI